MKRVLIIGGGLAGLISSIVVCRAGIACRVIEKKVFPFHRVCGEYVSNEVVPFLSAAGLFPHQFNPPNICKFQLSAVSGKKESMPLDCGGFGISRYTFDNFLYEQAKAAGVEFFLNEEVDAVQFTNEVFTIKTNTRALEADVVIGSFGKRSKLDHYLNRRFISRRSPYVGVKYHIKTDHPDDMIALHNFRGGYCGMSNIEDGKTTLCYLAHRDSLREHGSIASLEQEVLFQNPLIRSVFTNSTFLFNKPEVINEISFETKSAVEDHILMTGDAAGMIAPLCGNGMSMAIHAGKIAADLVVKFVTTNDMTRAQLEEQYSDAWNRQFKRRLWQGRQIQKLFGNAIASNIAVNLAINVRPIANAIMRSTHGQPF